MTLHCNAVLTFCRLVNHRKWTITTEHFMVYRDSVRPRSRHFGTTTVLTVTQFWWPDADLGPRTAGSIYTMVQIGLWHRIRLSGTFISVFVPRFVNLNLSSSLKYIEEPSNRHVNKIWFALPFPSDLEGSWANSNIAQLTELFAGLHQAPCSGMFIRTYGRCGWASCSGGRGERYLNLQDVST